MKRIMFLLFATLCVSFLNAQNSKQTEDNQYATFKLTNVALVQVEGIRHVDMLGTNQKYFVKLTFGIRKLDLELFETVTGKLVWATYSLPSGTYFQKDPVSSNDILKVYNLQNQGGSNERTCKVQFLKGVTSVQITVDYREKNGESSDSIVAIGTL